MQGAGPGEHAPRDTILYRGIAQQRGRYGVERAWYTSVHGMPVLMVYLEG